MTYREDNRGTLLCWHAERAGFEVLVRTVKALRNRRVHIAQVIYLVQKGREHGIPKTIEQVSIETIVLSVDDPTQHAAIYAMVHDHIIPRLSDVKATLHINVSPGTPAMHAVWLILHASGVLPEGTSLWSSQYNRETKRTRIDPVEFPVTTYLAEIHRLERAEPERAMYEPDARSPIRRAAFDRLARYARMHGAPLLILGERGTGKTRLVETIVSTLKNRSRVVTVPCGGLDSSLAESLLFGHRKGAFTGASSDRAGLLSESDGGILFLDEVQDLPKQAQRKLVRVFQDRQRRYRPVGSDQEESVDVELVCASNLPVAKLRKQLDADLFDRLSYLTIEVPALRDCPEDLHDDWTRVWRELRQREDLPAQAPWNQELEHTLARHPLPGNLRDLQRLAVLLMAWWSGHDLEASITAAEREWSQWTLDTPVDDSLLGTGTRSARIHWFRERLAQWAKDQYGTWAAAGKALDCDEKTLRQDAARDSGST